MIGRKDCPECAGTGDALDAFDRPDLCPVCVRVTADGLIAHWMTVESSRLYARLVHPAGKRRPS